MTTITLTLADRPARLVALALLLLSLIFNPAALAAPERQAASSPADVRPAALQLLSATDGYLIAGGRLYRTGTGGADWRDITPPEAAVIASHFTDARTGWAVLAPQSAPAYDPGSLRLVATRDGGQTWAALPAALPRLDADGPLAEAHLFFINPADGWLVWRFAGSSNFRDRRVVPHARRRRNLDPAEHPVRRAGALRRRAARLDCRRPGGRRAL